MTYEKPRVEDVGTVVDVTAATAVTGPLDGASFDDPLHHSAP